MPALLYCKTNLICVWKSSIRNFVSIWGGGIFPFGMANWIRDHTGQNPTHFLLVAHNVIRPLQSKLQPADVHAAAGFSPNRVEKRDGGDLVF